MIQAEWLFKLAGGGKGMMAAMAHRPRQRRKSVAGQVVTRGVRPLAILTSCALLCFALAPLAPVGAQPVVQPAPGGASQALNGALTRLGRDPRDLAALIDAGTAALLMGDVDAAIGFFARADQLSPNNARVKAGLAGALVRSENPYDAIPLFAEADRAGGMDPMLASDRGLAYDLVGDTVTAQRYYRQALAVAGNDETVRRLALSQAIAGDRAGMEATLSPLLQRQDKAAWRTRAFALGILGKPEEAVAIANQSMPADLANGIAPYLRYLVKLTPAQQAAAANFGRFPRAAEIGRDDPRVALYAPPRRVASADVALVPSGEPLGRGKARRDSRDNRRRQGEAAASPLAPPTITLAVQPPRSAPPPEPMPRRAMTAAPPLVVTPQTARPVAAPAPRPVLPPVRVAILTPPPPAPQAAAPRATAAAPQPGFSLTPGTAAHPTARFDLSRVPAPAPSPATPALAPVRTTVVAPTAPAPQPVVQPAPNPKPTPQPPAPAPRPRRVSDAFADFTLPQGPAAPAPGAVDIRKIAPARTKPPEPPKPAHPSRIWVQVGTGRSTSALGFTWRGLVKDDPELFRSKGAAISDWGRTNRLLTGPFATVAAANAYLAKLKKAGLDAFVWTSPAGQVIDDLPAR